MWPSVTKDLTPCMAREHLGAQLKDGPNIMKQTVSYILSLHPDVPSEIVELFVKLKSLGVLTL